jgi:hypothetical protein
MHSFKVNEYRPMSLHNYLDNYVIDKIENSLLGTELENGREWKREREKLKKRE